MNDLTVKDEKGLRVITINRPKAMNALNAPLIRAIGEACQATKDDATIHGIIITGAGDKAFAAGADIKGFPELSQEDAIQLSREGHEIFTDIENFPKPVIAAINGYALGGGLELAMSCHMRIATENAMFGMPEVKLGLIPGYGGTQRLAHLIGKAKAMEFILTANMMDAREAYRLGLVNEVVGSEALVAKAEELLQTIAKRGPLAISHAIKNINLSVTDQGFESEISSFAKLMVSDQAREGVAAFIEKRKPDFKKLS
ncbi:enoyl-CoA hydratase/isomerase family protein [Portibacter marinus]|uniref:enoyl-CoA hydratase/isomerase family protein n=1 Tax=Portibacter marinus TaxID=2898660 RepID=UPI001F2A5D7F|nr:enoyl-CoA hydratase-related protein [Portibacter marinus]